MSDNIIKKRWTRYIAKKSKVAIAFDFIFVVLLIAIIIPGTRQTLQSFVIRATMFQPHETKEVKYISKSESNWTLRDMQGNIVNLNDFKDEVLFINIWATWCPPCIAELPSIQELYNKYGNQIRFLLVSNEEKSVLDKFLIKKKYDLPVYQIISGQIPPELTSKSIPATYLISKNGRIVIDKKGAANWNGERMQEMIEQLLAE